MSTPDPQEPKPSPQESGELKDATSSSNPGGSVVLKEPKSFRDAGEEKNLSLGQEIVQMLRQHKKYWMIPLILALLAFGVLLVLGATSAAPFIYTLF